MPPPVPTDRDLVALEALEPPPQVQREELATGVAGMLV